MSAEVKSAVAALKKLATGKQRDSMLRYGIPNDDAFGVPIGAMLKLAKQLGRSHSLSVGLWKHGGYEPRTLAALVGEPEQLTAAQMEQWAKTFDSWAIVDTVCFKLFALAPPLAWKKVPAWCAKKPEFHKRAGFALIASLVAHDKAASDAQFATCLPLLEEGARDERNFVKKGVSWALRSMGRRQSLRAPALELAQRLAASSDATQRSVGKESVRDSKRR